MRIFCPNENGFIVFDGRQATLKDANGKDMDRDGGIFCASTASYNTRDMCEFMHDLVFGNESWDYFLKMGYLVIYGWRAADELARELDRS